MWTESKAVEIMKEAGLAENDKVIMGGVRFFLGGDKEREELEDESGDEDGGIDIRQVKHQVGINKKTKKKAKVLDKAVATLKKVSRPSALMERLFHRILPTEAYPAVYRKNRRRNNLIL